MAGGQRRAGVCPCDARGAERRDGSSIGAALALALTKPVPQAAKKHATRGNGDQLPNGARVSLDADVDTEALRRVLSARGDL